ncbi:hypothetical protein [Kutzneria sp. NPDC052558]|uniref:hypothetical protein n=1 Tax=Kutzneria sp. NPDC052558 TaxID=3364121 RepID=UPI0037CAF7BA
MAGRVTRTLVVIGTGSLANALCDAFACVATEPVEVLVVGRDQGKAAQLCQLVGVRAVLARSPVVFHDAGYEDLARLLESRRPDGVVVCASRQSPWEGPSAWTDLLAREGFGLSLPLHADIAARTGRAIMAASPETWLVNACFPDAVNPLLAAQGIPVICGVGNVATLAAALQAALGLPDQSRLRLVAHHLHLHAPDTVADEALAWLDGTPIADVTTLLAAQRSVDRAAANRVTGHTAALLLDTLLTGDEMDTHVPGPNGLPGGYPVRIHGGKVSLRLPGGLSEAEAVARNEKSATRDGVRADSDLDTLLKLRDELRARPSARRTESHR